jgi:hypothetical protein
MSEYNEISLYCYWILKYQPFYPIGSDVYKRPAYKINAQIAVELFLACVSKIRNHNNLKELKNIDKEAMFHSFCSHDISKEIMMRYMENMVEIEEI